MNTQNLLLVLCIFFLLFDLLQILFIKKLSKLMKLIGVRNEVDGDMWHFMEKVWLKSIHTKLKNGRERDIKLLQVLREVQDEISDNAFLLKCFNSGTEISIEAVSKECQSIKNVVGLCKNQSAEITSAVLQLGKDSKESKIILKKFDDTMEKARKQRGDK